MSKTFGTDYDGRKAVPIFDGVLMYFPDAIAAVAQVSVLGNKQHNPGEKLHWARGKSMDQTNTAIRHMIDHGRGELKDADGAYHLAKSAWRILAELQLAIEAERAAGVDFETEFKSVINPKAGIRDTSQPIPADVIQKKCSCGARVFAYRDGDLPPLVVTSDGIAHSPVKPCYHV
jgi:hypothetical protein